jgi:hypothetical protein
MPNATASTPPSLPLRIEATLNDAPYRPWCVHRLYEELIPASVPSDRDGLLSQTQRAADALVLEGRAVRETVSALAIGVHCEDSLYWSPNAEKTRLEDFGPEYESPTILRRLASHMYCHGL